MHVSHLCHNILCVNIKHLSYKPQSLDHYVIPYMYLKMFPSCVLLTMMFSLSDIFALFPIVAL